MDFILLSESGLRALLGAFHLCSTMSCEFYLYTHNCKRHWFCIFLIFETHLSRVAMAMHNIISAARPTMKARMIIQPGEMRTRGLEIHSFIQKCVNLPRKPGVLCSTLGMNVGTSFWGSCVMEKNKNHNK